MINHVRTPAVPGDSGTGNLGLTRYRVQAVLVKFEAVDNGNPVSCTFRVISRIFLGVCSLPCEENKTIGLYRSNTFKGNLLQLFNENFFFHTEFSVLGRLATTKSCFKNSELFLMPYRSSYLHDLNVFVGGC